MEGGTSREKKKPWEIARFRKIFPAWRNGAVKLRRGLANNVAGIE